MNRGAFALRTLRPILNRFGRAGAINDGDPQVKAYSTFFATIPNEVLSDKNLEATDVRVFGAMASSIRKQGVNIVSWHNTELAEIAITSERQVYRSLKALAKEGHISRALYRLNGRPTYLLRSEVFKERQPRLVSMPKRAKKSDIMSG